MNQNHTVTAINNMPHQAYGHKSDLVFRQYDNVHNLYLEFGDGEAKPRIEEDYGTKFMEELFAQFSRILRGMLSVLLIFIPLEYCIRDYLVLCSNQTDQLRMFLVFLGAEKLKSAVKSRNLVGQSRQRFYHHLGSVAKL